MFAKKSNLGVVGFVTVDQSLEKWYYLYKIRKI